jgi:hypothetical protein
MKDGIPILCITDPLGVMKRLHSNPAGRELICYMEEIEPQHSGALQSWEEAKGLSQYDHCQARYRLKK